jgi:hypothetical protein
VDPAGDGVGVECPGASPNLVDVEDEHELAIEPAAQILATPTTGGAVVDQQGE